VLELIENVPTVLAWRSTLALAYADTGDLVAARNVLDGLAAEAFGFATDPTWMIGMSLAAEAAVVAGAAEHASGIYERLAPYSGRVVVVDDCTVCCGALDRTLGILAAALGRYEVAEEHFESAFELNSRLGARAYQVRTLRGYAELLLARGSAGDRAKADAMITEASVDADALGMAVEQQRLEALNSQL
jgi:tetratricopeptide (TPR) repeat protein